MGEADRGLRRTAALVVALAVALAGCSEEPERGPAEPTKRVTAVDGSFELSVPEDWTTMQKALRDDVVVVERDPGGTDRVLVSLQRSGTGAEQRAITVSNQLSDDGVFCERFDGDETFGDPHLVFDCPVDDGTRQVLVAVVDEGRSALLVFRTRATTLESTADLITPILSSFEWTHG